MIYGVFLWKIKPKIAVAAQFGSGEGLQCLSSPHGLRSNVNSFLKT